MSTDVEIQGVRMSLSAAQCVEETGADVQEDVEALRSGAHTRDTLLAYCLDGVDRDPRTGDRVGGWNDYVSAVCLAAGVA